MSKGLDALERIGAEKLSRGELIRNDNKVEPYYKTIEKELKALEIIKKKDIDIYLFQFCKTFNEYNSSVVYITGETRDITQEEFTLLKEVLQ